MVSWELSELRHVDSSLLFSANLGKPSRRFQGKNGHDENDPSEDYMHDGCIDPLARGRVRDVNGCAPVREISKHDAQINRTTENANAKTSNATRCSFS